MPENDEAAVKALRYQDMLGRDAVYSYFDTKIPPAQQPLDPRAVNRLADALEHTVRTLSAGGVTENQLPRVPAGRVDRMPVEIFTELAMLTDFARRAGLPGGDHLSPTAAASSNEGLLQAESIVRALGKPEIAKRVAAAGTAPAGPPEGGPGRGAPAEVTGEQPVMQGNPYQITKSGSAFFVKKLADGKVMGKHPSRARALAQFRALEMAAHQEK